MELKIIEFPKRNLCVYKDESRLYYSTVKFKWGRRKITEIFDNENNKLFQVEYFISHFSEKFKIVSQNENLIVKIQTIDNSKIVLENSSILERKSSFFNITNSKFSYFYNDQKIGYSKVVNWVNMQKYKLNVEEDNKGILDLLIILILSNESGYSTD